MTKEYICPSSSKSAVARLGNLPARPEKLEEAEKAGERWALAVRAMGPKYSGIVSSTVCHELMPPAGQFSGLKLGLLRLAQYYGFFSKKSI